MTRTLAMLTDLVAAVRQAVDVRALGRTPRNWSPISSARTCLAPRS